MGRHSAPGEPPAPTGPDASTRFRSLGPVTDPLLLEGLLTRSRTDQQQIAPRPGTEPSPSPPRAPEPAPETRSQRRAAERASATGQVPVVERRAVVDPYRPPTAPQAGPYRPPTAQLEQPRPYPTVPAERDASYRPPTQLDRDDDLDDEEQPAAAAPAPVRASVTAAATGTVPLLQHSPAMDVVDESAERRLAAPSLRTDAGPAPTGVRDRPLQISWAWFGVALLAVAALSIVAVLPF